MEMVSTATHNRKIYTLLCSAMSTTTTMTTTMRKKNRKKKKKGEWKKISPLSLKFTYLYGKRYERCLKIIIRRKQQHRNNIVVVVVAILLLHLLSSYPHLIIIIMETTHTFEVLWTREKRKEIMKIIPLFFNNISSYFFPF